MSPNPLYGDCHFIDARASVFASKNRYALSPLYGQTPTKVHPNWGFYAPEISLYGNSSMARFRTSPSSSFLPLQRQESGHSNASQATYGTAPMSPTAFFKQDSSPAPSLARSSPTSSTDTLLTPDTFQDRRRLSFSPISSPSGWVPPQDVAFCRVIEGSYDSPRHSSPSMEGGKRPWSPREEQDPIRRSRIKTELCMHYVNNKECPFGSGCTYAHGEEELQLTRLMDLHRAGLVDVQTYRTKPCITWVSTGSCPFGKRCAGIHDPRVAGSRESWLPHTETQGNTIATDINVDALHQKRLGCILYDNPFGEHFSLDFDDYETLYRFICNTLNKRKRSALTERHKIEIALLMRGDADWQYKFRPQHIIHDELCMVLQKCAFCLSEEGVAEIPLSMFNSNFAEHVLVREIAFGPDCDPAVRGVSLWFNIEDKDVTVCTPQQAKRYRWKRGLKNDGNKKAKQASTSAFDNKEGFVMVRPLDKDAYNFSTEILSHRLEVLRAGRISNMSARFEALKALDEENRRLQAVFENYRRHWIAWSWPSNRDSSEVNDDTPAPKVDGLYTRSDELQTSTGSAVHRIWNSFVEIELEDSIHAPGDQDRLSVFQCLAAGFSAVHDSFSVLPHIRDDEEFDFDDGFSPSTQSERCWRALLLKDETMHEANEWEMVRKHFEYSRSKKVLQILQTPSKSSTPRASSS